MNSENVTEWFKRKSPGGKPSGGTSASRLYLAAFGKHPGWDDHIPGIGVDTEALANLKQSLYFDGIRGQIDAGAWEKMDQSKRMEGFDHQFLWLRPGRMFLGMMWSSSDRIGRAKYPMILCAEGDGFSPAFMLAHAKPEMESLRDTCKALTSAEEVTAECRMAVDRLRGTFERAQGGWTEPFSDTQERLQFLDCSELAPDRTGFLRILHEYSTEQGIKSENKTKQLRVPVISSLQTDSFTPWVEFFRCIVPSKTSVLFIRRNGAPWLDVILGEPAGRDFFCLQASINALPLTTQVPYEISADTISTFDAVAERFGFAGTPFKQSKPKAPVGPVAAPSVPSRSKSAISPLVLVGVIVIVVVVGVALLLFLRAKSPPVKDVSAAVNKTTAATAIAGDKYEAAMQSASDAFTKGDYDEAIRQANIALDSEPGDQVATQIKTEAINKKKEAESQASGYSGAMTAARNALAAGNYDEAVRQVKNALAISPGDNAAMTLDATIEARQDEAAGSRQSQYNAAMARGREDLANKNYSDAISQAKIALGFKAGDTDASHLIEQAQNAKSVAAQTGGQAYQTAMQTARAAFTNKNYDVAIQQADAALASRPGDAAAMALKNSAKSEWNSLQENQQYQSEINAVQAAWNKNDFDTVIQNASLALQITPGAMDLKSRLRESVYNKLEIYAVWFGVIKPQNATFQLAKTQSPLAQGDMAPSAANAYKNQIDSWLKMLNRYQLADDAHTKMAQAIEVSIDHY